MSYLKDFKRGLIVILAVVVALRIVLWAIEPFLPLIIGALVVSTVMGILIYRTMRF